MKRYDMSDVFIAVILTACAVFFISIAVMAAAQAYRAIQ